MNKSNIFVACVIGGTALGFLLGHFVGNSVGIPVGGGLGLVAGFLFTARR
jgi:hypothetical protein